MNRSPLLIAAAAIALFSASSLTAQDIERFRPEVPGREKPQAATGIQPEEAPPVTDSEGNEEVLATIRGIILLGHPDQAVLESPAAVTGVSIKDETLVVPDEAKAALEKFVNGPLTLRTIDEINRDTILAYREAGLPVVDVGFPEQEISGGILQIVIVVGRAGEIKLEGNKYFKDKIYRRSFTTKRGDVLYQAPIIKDLDYLNWNPYRQVNLAYTPGTEFGEADLILRAEERFPLTGYVGYEDTGNEFLGVDRLIGGFEWGNVGGWDHILGYQYTTAAEDFDVLHAHAATYRIPIWPLRHELRLLAGYVEVDQEFVAADTLLQSSGQSVQLTANYVIPLPEVFGYDHELIGGYDYKSTNNNLEFGGLEVFDTTAEIHQFSLGQNLNKKTKIGPQFISHRIVYSPGDYSNHNSDESFEQLRNDASSDYIYWTGEFTQRVDLPYGFTLIGNVEGQISNANLLPSETLILGGVGSVRGYEQNITRADQGIIANVELYAPPVSIIKMKDSARVFGFFDQAWAGNVDLLPDEPDNLQLGGAGVGIDYRISNLLSARVSYGWKVSPDGFEDDEDHDGRFHVSTTVRF